MYGMPGDDSTADLLPRLFDNLAYILEETHYLNSIWKHFVGHARSESLLKTQIRKPDAFRKIHLTLFGLILNEDQRIAAILTEL